MDNNIFYRKKYALKRNIYHDYFTKRNSALILGKYNILPSVFVKLTLVVGGAGWQSRLLLGAAKVPGPGLQYTDTSIVYNVYIIIHSLFTSLENSPA